MAKHNVWLSVSDLMTGLMVIFLFVAIAYIKIVQDNTSVLSDFVETKQRMYEKLVSEFKGDTAKWQMSITEDLSMKFNNPTTLFQSGSSNITPAFKHILNEFIPKYLDILLKDTLRIRIQEIRIEGHTDDVPYPSLHSDPYIANVKLSQERALNVLTYIRDMVSFKSYTEKEQKMLEFWFTANGLSYGRALDDNNNYIYETSNSINRDKSRRVEFRIVTKGEEVLENFVKQNNR